MIPIATFNKNLVSDAEVQFTHGANAVVSNTNDVHQNSSTSSVFTGSSANISEVVPNPALVTLTNDIANVNAYYDIVFRTATTGAIKTIDMKFPQGTHIPITSPFLVEVSGIEPSGTIRSSGIDRQTVTYSVVSPTSVPAGTVIRIELADITNPLRTGPDFQVTITTKDAFSLAF